jgi:hypothetical protein
MDGLESTAWTSDRNGLDSLDSKRISNPIAGFEWIGRKDPDIIQTDQTA